MYPEVNVAEKKYSLQSILFGHRIKPSQTKYEYLIEFLQVAIAPKRVVKEHAIRESTAMFPIDIAPDGKFEYMPKTRIGLKRFIFFPKSKNDGKARVDEIAYRECVKALKEHLSNGNEILRQDSIAILQNLLTGFSAVNQNRSWFDQNMLPICPEVILPEGLGVKRRRQNLDFDTHDSAIDGEFDYHRYTYMCRGGEVYYLHLMNAVSEFPEYRERLERRLNEMITSFPQFSYLCDFVQKTWENYYEASQEIEPEVKELGAIPLAFSKRNKFTLSELENFLNSKTHPFEKMEIFSNGIILQMLRMMYIAASTEKESNCWVIDVNCAGHENIEAKKCAITAFKHNEEVITAYLYRGLADYRDILADNEKATDEKRIKDAADDSYRLFRKMGKMIGIVIPNTGIGMRFTLSEDIIKFLVLAIVPPKHMITLDVFVEQLYTHFGMIIGPVQYKLEAERGTIPVVGDFSFLESNLEAFTQKLKDCGFLRDLSDATSIVENPYESENDGE